MVRLRVPDIPASLAAYPVLRRIASNLLWTSIGAVGQRGGLLVVSYVIAQLGGAGALGYFSAVLGTATMAGLLVGSTLGLTAARVIAERLISTPDTIGRIIGLLAAMAMLFGLFLAGVGLLFAESIAIYVLHDAAVTPLIRIAAPLVLLTSANQLLSGILAGFEAHASLARIGVTTGLLATGGALAGYAAGGVPAALAGWQIGALSSLCLGVIAMRRAAHARGVRLRCRSLVAERYVLVRFSLPVVLGTLLIDPVNWFCGTQLLWQPQGYDEFGVFQAANQWFLILMFVPNLVSQANLPVLTSLLAAGDERSFRRATLASLAIGAVVAAGVLALAVPNAARIMSAYGAEFAGRESVLILCLITAAIVGMLLPTSNVILSLGRPWAGVAMNAGWAIIFVVGTLLSAGQGADGLAAARLVAYAAHALWTLAFIASIFRTTARPAAFRALRASDRVRPADR